MNILIIGGDGYIGGVTAHLAQEAGHTVTVLDNLSTGRTHNIPKGATFIKGDVRDNAFIQHHFAAHTYDCVMHFAARIQVNESVTEPRGYFETNAFGALNVIDAAAKHGTTRYIFSSTAAVYGEPTNIPIHEDDPAHPVNPYGWSKLLAEELLQSYDATHKLEWTALRYFNVAGAYAGVGTDYPFVSHIIPALLENMKHGKPIVITGDDHGTPDGTCIRDYVHVADIATAHLLTLEAMAQGKKLNQPINLSSEHGYSVKQVAETFNKVTGANLPIRIGTRRTGDPAQLIASNKRAARLLGWQPTRDLATMIADHHAWYTAQANPNAPIT